MLVLARKEQEVIMIGEVKITIAKIMKNRVLIGIDAPQRMIITRENNERDSTGNKRT